MRETAIAGFGLLVLLVVTALVVPPVTLGRGAAYLAGFLSAACFIHQRRPGIRLAGLPLVPAGARRERLASTATRVTVGTLVIGVPVIAAAVSFPGLRTGVAFIGGLVSWSAARRFYVAWRSGRTEHKTEMTMLRTLAREWLPPRQAAQIYFREGGPAEGSDPHPAPKGSACALCGQQLQGLDDVRQAGALWFCSQSHFLAHEARPAPARPSRRRGIVELLVVVALVGGFVASLHLGRNSGAPSTQDEMQALQQGLKAVFSPGPPKHLTVHLDAAALAVADEYVHAEYVSHKCSELQTLVPPETDGVATTIDCSDQVSDALKYNDHLVRGSRVVTHDCPAAAFGPGIEANECVHYTLIGHNLLVSSINGVPVPGCDVTVTILYLQRQRGRWQVIGETAGDDRGGGCEPGDARLWRRRVRYAKT